MTEQLPSLLYCAFVFGRILRLNFHRRYQVDLFARIAISIGCVIRLSKVQPQQRIVATETQTLFKIPNRFLLIASQHSRGFEIELAQHHVSATCLKSFIEFQNSIHLFLYVFDTRKSRQHTVLRSASIVRSQPEVPFRLAVLEFDRGFSGFLAFAKSVVTLVLVAGMVAKEIVSPGELPSGIVASIVLESRLTEQRHRLSQLSQILALRVQFFSLANLFSSRLCVTKVDASRSLRGLFGATCQ